jgi:hypothetical protein
MGWACRIIIPPDLLPQTADECRPEVTGFQKWIANDATLEIDPNHRGVLVVVAKYNDSPLRYRLEAVSPDGTKGVINVTLENP